jgi:acyl carrier protein
MDPEVKVRQIICDLLSCDVEELSDDAFLADDLSMTPDDLEELVTLLNDEFEIDVPEVDGEDWETVSDVIAYVLEKLGHEQ